MASVERMAEPRRPRILVVDDTVTNRRLLQAILKKKDYEILEAADGDAAIELIHATRPDLILLDIMMPRKDGYEVCRELQTDPATRDIPVIFLSAKTLAEDRVKGLEMGAVDYITKPYDRAEILARVHTHIHLRALTESLELANRDLSLYRERAEADLKAASVIQRSLIPSQGTLDRIAQIDVAWWFSPCQSIGGDVFNVVRLDEYHVGIYVIDVSGHGVPSAMVTVSVSQQLHPQSGVLKEISPMLGAYRLREPSEVLERLDEQFPLERFGKYFTMAYSVLDLRDGSLKSARAAHPPSYLVRKQGGIERIEPAGTLVGLGGLVPFQTDERRLEPGDRLFCYTDGIVEYPNPAGERFGDARLREALQTEAGDSLEDLCASVRWAVESFSGELPPEDDISLLALEYRGAANPG
ncbi:MAG: hypothetical protein DHS20C21_02620 [Gemmatimonadota bacterium]|nr:MAG: hypothetical protein DHS20C21_02620 [Gemmatimonadota bacterium]